MFKFLKLFKQELLFIPLMALIIEGARNVIIHLYPDTALFDRGSELETFIFRVWQITWITSATWFLMWIVFPAAHKSLVKFYHDFPNMLLSDQRTYATRIFLVFFFGLVLLLSGKAQTESELRKALTDTLNSQLFVREATGHNDGVDVERYLKFVGRTQGDAWCAAFASYNLHAVGIQKPINPLTAWAPAFSNVKYVTWSQCLQKQHKARKPNPGDCFTLFYPQLNRVGHVGFIVAESGNYFITIEGNTGLSGSREGSGVHKLKRAKNKVYSTSDYITVYLKLNENNASKKTITRVTSGIPANPLYIPVQGEGTYNRKRRAAQRQHFYKNRQYLVQGFPYKSDWRTYQYTGHSTSGFERQSTDGLNTDILAQIKSYCFHQRWEIERGVFVQGLGIKSTGTTAFNSSLQKGRSVTATRKNFRNNGRAPIYT